MVLIERARSLSSSSGAVAGRLEPGAEVAGGDAVGGRLGRPAGGR